MNPLTDELVSQYVEFEQCYLRGYSGAFLCEGCSLVVDPHQQSTDSTDTDCSCTCCWYQYLQIYCSKKLCEDKLELDRLQAYINSFCSVAPIRTDIKPYSVPEGETNNNFTVSVNDKEFDEMLTDEDLSEDDAPDESEVHNGSDFTNSGEYIVPSNSYYDYYDNECFPSYDNSLLAHYKDPGRFQRRSGIYKNDLKMESNINSTKIHEVFRNDVIALLKYEDDVSLEMICTALYNFTS